MNDPTPSNGPAAQATPRFPLGLVISTSLAVAATTGAAVLWVQSRQQPELQVVGPEIAIPLPEFTFTDRTGAPFGSADLRGKVWVADFVFTRCESICPKLSDGLAKLQQELATHPRKDEVRLVSFSVDPEHDRPEVLSDYAARFGADARTWRFLTGERAAIWSLCNDGFKLPVEEDAKDDPARLIFHSAKLVLVDRQGQIRDYFTGVNAPPEERARLLEAIDALLEEPAPPG